jgi:hypothetical protein
MPVSRLREASLAAWRLFDASAREAKSKKIILK